MVVIFDELKVKFCINLEEGKKYEVEYKVCDEVVELVVVNVEIEILEVMINIELDCMVCEFE